MGKLALITGATSGIGAAYSTLLASKGWDLVITGRRENIIFKRAEDLREKYNIRVDVSITDFTKDDEFNEFLENYIKRKGFEFVVNNVGFSNHSNFFGTSFKDNSKMIDVHISRMCEIIHTVIPAMKLTGGTVVNVSSLAGYLPSLSDPFYSGTKSFINTYTESIAMILKDENIKVQVLCPGFTRTDFHKNMNLNKKTFKNRGLKRWMNPKSVVKYSYRKLKTGKVVVIPGLSNRIVYSVVKLLPKKFYYKMASKERVLDEK